MSFNSQALSNDSSRSHAFAATQGRELEHLGRKDNNPTSESSRVSSIGEGIGRDVASFENSSAPKRLSSLYNIPASFINQTISTVHNLCVRAKFANYTLSDYERAKAAAPDLEETEEVDGSDTAGNILAEPFLHFVKFINPNAKIKIGVDNLKFNFYEKWTVGTIVDCRRSENLFTKHIVSRLVLSMLIVTTIVQDIAHGIFGVTTGALAILSLGLSERLNNWATCGLLQANVVASLPFFGIIMYNPSMLGVIDLKKV